MKKKILLGLAVVLLAIQALRPARNESPVPPFTGQEDITVLHPPPPGVKQILATACYDCHSNHTRYPWYANVQPVGWWLEHHVNEGRRNLNFEQFGGYAHRTQLRKLESASDEVRDRTMPLRSYRLIHRDARLTDAQVKALGDWLDGVHDQLGGD